MIEYRAAQTVIVIFALIGAFFTGNLLHELSHRNDFKDLVDSDYICLLDLNEGFAYYRFHAVGENFRTILSMTTYSEVKAYTAQIIMYVLIGWAFIVVKGGKEKYE